MSATGGYDSEVNLQNIQFVGDFPLENSLGGFGLSTGAANNYVLTLNPPLTQYRIGMPFQVKFNVVNTGASTLNVDSKGAIPLKKIVNGALVDLIANDINTTRVFFLVYDGTVMQVVSGIELLDLSKIPLVGDIPLENSIGGFGQTTGATDNFILTLNTSITQYRLGMHFQVIFNHTNGGAATLNIDGQGVASLMKIVGGVLVNLDTADINPTGVYDLVFDGVCLQVVTGIEVSVSSLPQASEVQTGISRFGTTSEVDLGVASDLGVSVFHLARYVADKVTGLWENKGLIDASTNPNYPAGLSGDAYTINVAGKIGGASGITIEVRDVLYCINDNAGGNQATVGADWNIVQVNIDQATDLIAGIVRIGTSAEAIAGVLTDVAITPKTLSDVIAASLIQATQSIVGTSRFGTTAEVISGLLLNVGVSPKTLKDRLDNYLNRETVLSISSVNINPDFRTTPSRNKYVAVNGNMIMGKDIRFKPSVATPATFGFVHVLNFPKPLNSPTPHQPTVLFSTLGNIFILQMDADGKVFLSGTFNNGAEELLLNLTPYIAKFPLEFHETQPPS